MRQSILAAGAALLLCSAAATAQTNTTTDQSNNASATDTTSMTNGNVHAKGSLRAEVRDMLQKQGFSDIQVLPSSFIVRAKDKDGNPVVMSMSPDSIMEIAEVDTPTGEAGGRAAGGPATGSEFVAVQQNDELTSNLVGLDVYNNSNQKLGQIKDVAMNPQGHAQAYILSVGGVAGVGARYVAVKPSDLKVSYNDSDKKWHATMNATADQLKNAPEFKYEGRFNASKS